MDLFQDQIHSFLYTFILGHMTQGFNLFTLFIVNCMREHDILGPDFYEIMNYVTLNSKELCLCVFTFKCILQGTGK
jgi:hypothetical protein